MRKPLPPGAINETDEQSNSKSTLFVKCFGALIVLSSGFAAWATYELIRLTQSALPGITFELPLLPYVIIAAFGLATLAGIGVFLLRDTARKIYIATAIVLALITLYKIPASWTSAQMLFNTYSLTARADEKIDFYQNENLPESTKSQYIEVAKQAKSEIVAYIWKMAPLLLGPAIVGLLITIPSMIILTRERIRNLFF